MNPDLDQCANQERQTEFWAAIATGWPRLVRRNSKRTIHGLQSSNPADGKLLKKFPDLTDKELETSLATVATYFKTWRHETYAERAVIVAKAAVILHDKAEEFAHAMTLEMGKRFNNARGEVETTPGAVEGEPELVPRVVDSCGRSLKPYLR